jgi:hypothetical protein
MWTGPPTLCCRKVLGFLPLWPFPCFNVLLVLVLLWTEITWGGALSKLQCFASPRVVMNRNPMGRGGNVALDATASCDHIKSQIMLLHGVATAWELSYTSLILAATSGTQLPPWVITTQPTWDKLQGTHTQVLTWHPPMVQLDTQCVPCHRLVASTLLTFYYPACMHALQAYSVPLGDCLASLRNSMNLRLSICIILLISDTCPLAMTHKFVMMAACIWMFMSHDSWGLGICIRYARMFGLFSCWRILVIGNVVSCMYFVACDVHKVY